MLIRAGFEIGIEVERPTPVTFYLTVHPDVRDAVVNDTGVQTNQPVTLQTMRDIHGNEALRCLAPEGRLELRSDTVIDSSGRPDPVDRDAREVPVDRLPPECHVFLLPSRYCETEYLSDLAWKLFGSVSPGWDRVQAICDYVHERLVFSYGYARPTRTACQAHDERAGVCRDFAHLAITLCRCLNIPARYVNGFMGDIGIAPKPAPMDFNAWIEVYLSGRWHVFDARHNERRIGRITVARGRDAADIPLIHTFGAHRLDLFNVWTYEARTSQARPEGGREKHSLVDPWHSAFWARHSNHVAHP